MAPLVFEPFLRPLVWGGRHLEQMFGKVLPGPGPFGESWEISAHPLHVSTVADGPWQGTSLADLCAVRSGDLFGPEVPHPAQFPLLIKLLDCCDLLSIQVHPSDELAPRLSKETQGKTEAWVVLDVQSTGRIFSGLKEGVGRADLERHLQAGTLAECLHSFTPQPGDCLFLPAGTVHAVGGGVVMAEVQQSSDATFRLFDWNRLGLDGKPRPVHLRESLESIDWNAGPVSPVPGTPLSGLPQGVQGEHLVQCRYFALARFQGVKPFELPYRGRLSIWLVLQGAVQLRSADPGYQRQFQAGQAALIPAACGALFWQPAGPATLLGVTLGS